MPQYLIEVPHSGEFLACVRVVEVFLKSWSHFLTHAHWGCEDGVHSAWMIVEVDSKREALGIVPPAFRSEAKVVCLCSFTMPRIEELLRQHQASKPAA